MLGDLGAQAQLRLLRAGVPSASVVAVTHYGSAVGLVGVRENDYEHPTDASPRLVREAGGQPLRTDRLGTIALAVDDGGVRVWSERVGGPP